MGDCALHHILPQVTGALELKKYVNFLMALASRRQRYDRVVAKPIDMTIDLTTTCQLHCPYCAVGNGAMRRPVTLMQKDTFAKLVDELGDTMFVCWYFSTGEPLLHKQFGSLLSLTRDKQIFGVISTNLSLPLSDERVDEILQCGLRMISVSLDGASAETYSRYRVGGQYDLVVGNLRRLIARKKELGLAYPLLEWRFLIFQHNQHEVETARRMAQEMGVDLLEFYPGYTPDAAQEGQVAKMTIAMPTPNIQGPALDEAMRRKGATLRTLIQRKPSLPAPPQATAVSKCDWLYYSGMVYPNGSFGPCCVATNQEDDFTDLHRHAGFIEAWNSEKFVAARQAFREERRSGTVCDRCPLPAAQHYQFVQKVRAILLNAPDWVLKILHQDLDAYFFDVDATYLPQELSGIRSLQSFNVDRADITAQLQRYGEEAAINSDTIARLAAAL